jgi:hypothetical protein
MNDSSVSAASDGAQGYQIAETMKAEEKSGTKFGSTFQGCFASVCGPFQKGNPPCSPSSNAIP